MTQAINGCVVGVNSERRTAKATGKPFTVHSVSLDTGETLEVGFKQPYVVGQRVVGTAEMKYGKLALVSSGGGSVPMAAGGGSPPTASAPAAFPTPLNSKEMSICRQSALKAAVDVFNVVGGATTRNLFDDKVLDEVAEQVIKLAYKFTDFSTGHREVKMVKDSVDSK